MFENWDFNLILAFCQVVVSLHFYYRGKKDGQNQSKLAWRAGVIDAMNAMHASDTADQFTERLRRKEEHRLRSNFACDCPTCSQSPA